MTQITEFDQTSAGSTVHAVDIASPALKVRILTYGAIINDVRLAGHDIPLTLGAATMQGYEGRLGSFGALMGPVVNRIKGAKAVIDGHEYKFERHHSGDLTQHSGSTGIHKQIWDIADYTQNSVTLTLSLPDGLGGFAGQREISVIYTVQDACLLMDVRASSDAPTPFNPANHSYWALDGALGFAGHKLQVFADSYTEPDSALMPTGRVLPVAGSDLDFRDGRVLAGDDSAFYDVNLCVSDRKRALTHIASLTGQSGVRMKMFSTECGLQIFDCGTINAPNVPTHHGQAGYAPYAGFALEAQSWPGALAHDTFPPIILRPDAPYQQLTAWEFDRVE